MRLDALSESERAAGVVACSSGNHGHAVAYVAQRLDIRASVYVPEWVDPVKLDGIRACGAELVPSPGTFDDVERLAIERAADDGRVYVSAYDDPWIITGQGTIGLEIKEQLGRAPGSLLAPLSGGGLIGGIAAALAGSTKIVAVSAERAPVMAESVRAGRPIELPEEETIASALAGGIGLANRHSFPLVRDLVDHHARVSEDEIQDAMRYAATRLGLVVEGGGAVALAALLHGRVGADALAEPVVVVLSGGNVSPELLARVLRG